MTSRNMTGIGAAKLSALAGGLAIASVAIAQPNLYDPVDAALQKAKRPNAMGALAQPRAGVPSAGEVCLQATPIVNGSSFDFDNTLTSGGWDEIDLLTANTPNPGVNFCIGNTTGTDRNTYWFSFVATSTSALAHTCDSVATDSSAQMYSGSCGSLVEIACSEDVCGPTTFNSYLYGEGLTVGETYYIQVGSWNLAAAGAYNLKLICPAPDCTTCSPTAIIDNDGPCLDVDFVQNGDPAASPSVPPGNNNNFGCVEPDLAAGDTPRFQDLGLISTVEICGTLNHSQRSDQPATAFFTDFDWYTFFTPTDATNGALEQLDYLFSSNTSAAFFIMQLGPSNLRGCDGDTLADLDINYAAFPYYPLTPGSGFIPGCNATYEGSVSLPDGEEFNLIVRKTRAFDAPALCVNEIGREYTVLLDIADPPIGACCFPDDTCAEVLSADCFGIYRGDFTYCAGNPNGLDITGRTEASACPDALPCPPGGFIENQGLGEFYEFALWGDIINSGCNAQPHPLTGQIVPIAPDLVQCGETWCATTGTLGNGTRNMDWYRFTLTEPAQVTITLDGQVPMQLFVFETFDGNFITCQGETVVGFEQSTTENGTLVLSESLCAGDYYIVTAPGGFVGFDIPIPTYDAWDYLFSVACDPVLQVVGACCLSDASCIETDPCTCGELAGWFYGEGSVCAEKSVLCCTDLCDVADAPENEPSCFAGYQDFYNSGCDARKFESFQTNGFTFAGDPTPDGIVEIDPFIDATLGQVFCGTIGAFTTNLRLSDGSIFTDGVNDTDWYRIQHAGGVLQASVHADRFIAQVRLLHETAPSVNLCEAVSNDPLWIPPRIPPLILTQDRGSQTAASCAFGVVSFGVQPPGLYYLVVSPINTVFGAPFSCTDPRDYRFAYGPAFCACPNVDDSDGLGEVNLADLVLTLFNFGGIVEPGENGDADCDGDVDLDDLSTVLFAFGTSLGC